MYAIFETGGKQYRVQEGQIINIEKLNINIGNIIEFNKVMIIRNKDNLHIGYPFVIGSKIIAEVISHFRNKKVMILKFGRRKHYRKHQGHRQWFTNIKINFIVF